MSDAPLRVPDMHRSPHGTAPHGNGYMSRGMATRRRSEKKPLQADRFLPDRSSDPIGRATNGTT